MKTDTPQTFSQLLREGNKFTDRDFMKVLATSHTKLKRLEADPAQFTISDLMLLAQLIERPIKEVMKVVMAQAERDEEAAEKRGEAIKQATGRKYFPRKPKEDRPTSGL
jgi:transcriptional regulator with XRE-family HTH domain